MTKSLENFKLFYTKSAVKEIKKLDTVTQKKLGKKLKTYSKKPYFYAKKLSNSLIGSYRWRIGSYRVIFDVQGKKIIILKVGHRKEIYKSI